MKVMPFRLRTLFIVTAGVALPFAFGPPLDRVGTGREGNPIYEPNVAFLAVALLVGIVGWVALLRYSNPR